MTLMHKFLGASAALALTAGELMRKQPLLLGPQTHLRKQTLGDVALLLIRDIRQALKRITHDLFCTLAWVQTGIGILKDELHLTPDLAQILALQW